MEVKEGILCAFAGNLIVLGILIMFPQIMDYMLKINYWISVPVSVILLILAGLIFQWSVSKPQTIP